MLKLSKILKSLLYNTLKKIKTVTKSEKKFFCDIKKTAFKKNAAFKIFLN